MPNRFKTLAATESLLRRSCADQLRRAHSARRVREPRRSWCCCDGADAAATELMLRAALLRRSCDGVAAATELASCADQLVALILRVASSPCW